MTLPIVTAVWEEGTALWGPCPADFERFNNALAVVADEDLLEAWDTFRSGNKWPTGAQFSNEITRIQRLKTQVIERERSREIIGLIRDELKLTRKTEMVGTISQDTAPTIPERNNQ